MHLRLLSWAMILTLGTCLTAGARGQAALELPPDPYLKGDRALSEAAGFVDTGRFAWGDGHGTLDIEELLGKVPLRWVETAHFKIGSTLPQYSLEKDERSRVKEELTRLAQRIPRVKARTKTLDPWLRLYLYAQRLEDLYAELAALLGHGDTLQDGLLPGMEGKLCVLLLEKKSSLGRYAKRYGTSDGNAPVRLNFPRVGSLCFVSCTEFFDGEMDKDAPFYCQLVWGVCQNILAGYEGYTFSLPRWLADGMSYWCQRRIDPEYPSFSQMSGSKAAAMADTEWPRKVRARVKVDVYPTAATMIEWQHTDKLPLADHTMMFSRVDYLLSREDDSFARFMKAVKQPIDAGLLVPGHELVRDRVTESLASVYGFTLDDFDQAWAEWVLKTYPRR